MKIYELIHTGFCMTCGKDFKITESDYEAGKTKFRCPYCNDIVTIDNPNAPKEEIKTANAVD